LHSTCTAEEPKKTENDSYYIKKQKLAIAAVQQE